MKCTNLHRYKRTNIGSKKVPFLVFQCQDCSHYLRPEVFVGKMARCIYCNNDFKILPQHKKMKFVHCLDCTKKRENRVDDTINDIMEKLGVK